ncbi:RmlC-like jelly roll fold [Phytophthora cactorum]|nr:RmlC-like jelly roll fold [Phytophthora cactorum]
MDPLIRYPKYAEGFRSSHERIRRRTRLEINHCTAPPKHPHSAASSNDVHTSPNRQEIVAREQSEDAGARVYRSVGSAQLRSLDPFLVLDEASVGLPGGFPAHPHRGFETVSYILPTSKGYIHHEDFLGNKASCDLWMTAGRGIMHSEMPKTHEPAHGLQLWVNLPKHRKMVKPRYQEVPGSRSLMPSTTTKVSRLLSSPAKCSASAAPLRRKRRLRTYILCWTQEPSWSTPFLPRTTRSCTRLAPHEAIDGEGGRCLLLTAADNDKLEVIVMTGEPLNEPVVQYGPFVMN